MQGAAGLDRDRGAPGVVRAGPHGVGEGIPAVEAPDHRYGAARVVDGKREGDPDRPVTPGFGCLDQLLSPLSALSELGRTFDSNVRAVDAKVTDPAPACR